MEEKIYNNIRNNIIFELNSHYDNLLNIYKHMNDNNVLVYDCSNEMDEINELRKNLYLLKLFETNINDVNKIINGDFYDVILVLMAKIKYDGQGGEYINKIYYLTDNLNIIENDSDYFEKRLAEIIIYEYSNEEKINKNNIDILHKITKKDIINFKEKYLTL